MRRINSFLLMTGILFLLTACYSSSDTSLKSYDIYYLNSEKTELVKEEWKTSLRDDDTLELAKAMLLAMKNGEDANFKSPLGKELEVNDVQEKELQLSVYFSAAYNGKTGTDEILSRAAIVRTLCQIPGIDYVDFYVEDQPLMISGNAVGLMSEESFISDLEQRGEQLTKKVTLYFSNQDGNALVANATTVKYNTVKPLASMLVEQLIRGEETISHLPKKDKLLPVLSSDVVVNNVTVRENVCYIDFSKEINNHLTGIDCQVVIYSIVNTLCELPNVNYVQFTVDGEPQEQYGEMDGFHQIFERNLDLVEKENTSE